MTVLIIEDETAAAQNFKAVLKSVEPGVQVLAVLDSIKSSVSWLKTNAAPDLIFMDINLADGSSFEIFDRATPDAPVIFITAFDEYAIQAFKVNAIDYLLKPIKTEEVAAALSKYKKLSAKERAVNISRIASMAESTTRPKALLVFYKDRLIPLPIENIECFYSQNDKVQAITNAGVTYSIEKSLNALSYILNADDFFRANRQCIISRRSIKEIIITGSYRLQVILGFDVPEPIFISKERAPLFKEWLQS